MGHVSGSNFWGVCDSVTLSYVYNFATSEVVEAADIFVTTALMVVVFTIFIQVLYIVDLLNCPTCIARDISNVHIVSVYLFFFSFFFAIC